MDDSATATMRATYFVPETKLAQLLFAEMRTHGHQLAMVSDECGSVAGLVTLKRLIQGIVGRVEDEEETPAGEVAGLILEQLRRVPDPDDEVVVGDVHLRVVEMQGFRIARVMVTHTPPQRSRPIGPRSEAPRRGR